MNKMTRASIPADRAARHGSSTVRKAIQILNILAQSPRGIGLSEIARAARLHHATAHRLLQTLVAGGLAECGEADRRYQLGLRVLDLAGAVIETLEVREVARPVLAWLAATSGEAAQIATFDRDEMVVLERVDGPEPVTLVQTRLGFRMAMHDTALGKAFLAFAPPEVAERLRTLPLTRSTEHTITDRAAFTAHLAQIRRQGYAIDNEERRLTVRCVGAPIFDHAARTVAAIGIAGPAFRLSLRRARECGEIVREAAQRVSRALGYDGGRPSAFRETDSHPRGGDSS